MKKRIKQMKINSLVIPQDLTLNTLVVGAKYLGRISRKATCLTTEAILETICLIVRPAEIIITLNDK